MHRIKEKKKTNPFSIITVLLLLSGIAGFIIKTVYFTPKETIVKIGQELPKTTISTTTDLVELKPNSTEEKNLNYRKNWKEFISIGTIHRDVEYTVTPENTISSLNVPIINKTDYTIESITIKVLYMNPGNNNAIEGRVFEVKNVLPGSHFSYKSPDNNVKGVNVICEIIKMHSGNFDFCFDVDLLIDSQARGGFSGNPADPWHCK